MTACPRCAHDAELHGYGCTVGWLQEGDECHCPMNHTGMDVMTCGRVGCTIVGTHVDSFGQFYCDTHQEGVHIDRVTSWT